MDFLKRSLVRKIISYDIKNNLIENECYKLGYSTRYSSGYLARLLLSEYSERNDFIIDDSLFNGYIEESNTFINILFLEYGYNYTTYLKNEYKVLNECANYFMHYLEENELENELDSFNLISELNRIDNLLNYSKINKLNNLTYNLYLYFYEDKSKLAIAFEKYINNYINSNFDINFKYNIRPIKELYDCVKGKEVLEKLEYYDLLKNDYTYEKIMNEIINVPNIEINDLMNKYSISKRTAYYLKGEYDICNDTVEQYIELNKLIITNNRNNNLDIIEPLFIRSFFLLSSYKSACILSSKLKDIIFNELIDKIHNGYYKNEIENALKNSKDIDNKTTGILNFSKYLKEIYEMDLTKDENKKGIIIKFVEQIYVEKNKISIKLYPLKKLAK